MLFHVANGWSDSIPGTGTDARITTQHVEIKPTALYDVLIMECLFHQLNTKSQEKISRSLVLKLKVFFPKYLQEHYTWCIMRVVLFFKNVPGTFFNATHQVKAIAIAVSEVKPSGLTVDCSTPLHSTRILNQFIRILCERPTPLYPLLYGSLFLIFW